LIRLVRQSTTVPNTSNTNALTPEMSDMVVSPYSVVIPGWPEGPGPKSITTIVSMDSGLAASRRPRNDDG
jgi:hypothetical protein